MPVDNSIQSQSRRPGSKSSARMSMISFSEGGFGEAKKYAGENQR